MTLDHEVICDEKKLMITQSCHVVSKKLRLASEHRMIWIDALCPKGASHTQVVDECHKHLPFTKLPFGWFQMAVTFLSLMVACDLTVLCGPESIHWDDLKIWRHYY
ncbi:hypothetical protein B0T14DRAFT_559086 [Immersiella caudata]|uniref:Uncharacterized protein n=1 Tax=Immersiella caudata TaxID=314043 RepID=A0AA39XCA2_9PEZI|nr:hypothetical protein B0T14DRAFT_559086 [Immersiella caudata]